MTKHSTIDPQRHRRTVSMRFGALAIDGSGDRIDVHRQTHGLTRCGTKIRLMIGSLFEIALRRAGGAAFGGGAFDDVAKLPVPTMHYGKQLDRRVHGPTALASELEPEGVEVRPPTRLPTT